ncbi:BrnT family toxin [Microcoleus sp. MON1_C1]|uniref:BrnT family toxin n=1 Tax=Microcoleus sp. MON1_C1 TaxID=2818827 RepID=UPI002FD7064B
MQFEWDEAKNIKNIRKHQINFADVPAMFDGEMLIELDDVLIVVKIAGWESVFSVLE